jgi:copper(I)-binding protein
MSLAPGFSRYNCKITASIYTPALALWRLTMKLFAKLSLALSLLLAAGPGLAESAGLQAVNPWVREAPPTADTSAAYMELRNTGKDEIVVTGVSCPDFGHSMIHDTVIENGVAKMIHADELRIPAGQSVTLSPGGKHLMLMMRQRPLKAGDQVKLQLDLAGGGKLAIDAPVKTAE